jgi:putative membrane protein
MSTKISAFLLFISCLLVMLAGISIAQNQSTSAQGNSNTGTRAGNANSGQRAADTKFAMTAAMDGMTEVELGRLAVQKGVSEAVKQFGQRMIDDHTAANQQLTQLASQKGITLPTALDPKHAAMVQKFQRLTGAQFDREYTKQMVQDHRKAVALFQKEAANGTDAEMKAFASSTLPTLNAHLSMAQSMSGNKGGMSGNMNGNMGGNSNGNTNTNRNGNANNP